MNASKSIDAALRDALEKQMGVLRDRVRDVPAQRRNSAYFYGPSGTGKTHLVRQTLEDGGTPYHYHAGHLTAIGYFELLKEHASDTIVLDDVSGLFASRSGQELLLASLGTVGGNWDREVRYQRRGGDEVVRFSGGILAISNVAIHDKNMLGAIKSRTRPLCWNPSQAQLAVMMRDAVRDGWQRNNGQLEADECIEVVDFVVEKSRFYHAPLDLRLLFDCALPDYLATKQGAHEIDWRDHVITAISEQITDLQFSGAPSRQQRLQVERKFIEDMRASRKTRRQQLEAWTEATGKSERAFDRRSRELRVVS